MNWKRRSLLLTACGLAVALSGCGGTGSGNGPSPTGTGGTNSPAEPSAPAAAVDPVKVTMETSKGTIKLELYPDKAPASVENFVSYVKKGQYDGTIFHRVISSFMIQGGGMTPDMKERDTQAPIKNESDNGLKNERGSLAMARLSDPDSATCQFYINVVDNPDLDFPNAMGSGYAVFGKVTAGMDVADKIRSVPTGPGDIPVDPVLIKSIKLDE